MESQFDFIEKAARLLARKRMRILTDQECDELEQLMETSPEIRRLAQKWMQEDYLSADFRDYQAIDITGPLAQINHAIAETPTHLQPRRQSRRKHMLITLSAAVAAALVLVFVIPSGLLERRGPSPIPLITEQAPLLFFEDGSQIDLSNSTMVMENGTIEIHRENSVAQVVQQPGNENNQPACMTIQIPKGHTYKVTLGDGTKIWLNAQSELYYPAAFGGETREVRLEGEAYFDVAPDPSRPFRVEAGDQRVEVLGTEFNIRAYANEHAIYTTLLEGSVEVATANDIVTLTPGTQAILSNGVLSTRPVNAANVAGWRDGMFYLEEESLDRIMIMLTRWYDFRVAYEDEKLKDIIFNCMVPRYDDLGRILDLLAKTDEVSFEIRGDKVTVKKAQL